MHKVLEQARGRAKILTYVTLPKSVLSNMESSNGKFLKHGKPQWGVSQTWKTPMGILNVFYEALSSGFSGNPCLSNRPQKCLHETRKETLPITV